MKEESAVYDLKRFYWRIAVIAVIYIFITFLTPLIKNNADLVDVVTMGKMLSLGLVLLVNGKITKEIDKNQNDIKRINQFLLVCVLLIIIITFIKFISIDINKSSASTELKYLISLFYASIYWIGIFPLIGYAILDFYIAYIRRSTIEEKNVAKTFFIFVDIACVFPLLLIYIITISYTKFFTSKPLNEEVFMSGSMAVVLMSSAIATKAVEIFFYNKNKASN